MRKRNRVIEKFYAKPKVFGSKFYAGLRAKEEISGIFMPISKHPQIILAEGAPGIGKTMFMRETAYRWATNEILEDKVHDIKVKNDKN